MINDQIILKEILQQKKAAIDPDIKDGEFFELFVAEQVLKNFELSYEEISTGLTGGGSDGGIDAIYAFANGELLNEDTDISGYKKDINLELFIIQAKTTPSFSETALDKFIAVTDDILDLSKPLSNFDSVYNDNLMRTVNCFQSIYKSILTKHHKLTITYIYASFGDSQQVHPNVDRKKVKLHADVSHLFSDSYFDFLFLGARDLLQLFRKVPSNSFQLTLLENAISTNSAGAEGYLCLVSLQNYYSFISDENGNLRKNIFDSNVRDYQGKVEVNEGIKETLTSGNPEDFWWLNNGITMIATRGSIVGKAITLEDPQIVNGLQTSREIFDYFKSNPRTSDPRSVLIRIIVISNSVSRDKIIKATNSQTAIPSSSLKATDAVQRDIEDFFLTKGLYYDRRKNFYKNQGHPKDKILDIPYLAQAIMAIILREPHNSRARPSSLLKKDDDYNRIFNHLYSVELYLTCAKIMKRVDAYMKSDQVKRNLNPEEKHNLRFHVAMYVALAKLGNTNYKPLDIMKIDLDTITPEFLSYCLGQVVAIFRRIRESSHRLPDTIAKTNDFVQALQNHFNRELREATHRTIHP